jgi:2'-hydroxyisoflavone reductase
MEIDLIQFAQYFKTKFTLTNYRIYSMNKLTSRRAFLAASIKTGLATAMLNPGVRYFSALAEKPSKKLNILILGGTSFLGPHQIAYALERGHSISIFTRGKTKSTIYKELYDQVEQLTGDRKDDLSALKDRTWDAVIDNSGREVDWTQRSAELLKDTCELYMYTSSTGVYYPYINSDFTEESKVLQKEPEVVAEEEKLEYWYGVMKANSELAARKAFGGDRTIVVRPTYMIGPADRSNRFIYWPVRLSRGGDILVPGRDSDKVQYIDVRDVAEWMIRLIEDKKTGIFNAVGPASPQNMMTFIKQAAEVFDVKSNLIQVDDYPFLKAQQIYYIVPWIMQDGKNAGTAMISNEKAKLHGLGFRDLKTSVKDSYDWWYSDAISQELRDKYELDKNSLFAKEIEILEAWKAK